MLTIDGDEIKYPICPINMYFEGDEDKCNTSKCDWNMEMRGCTEACRIKKIPEPCIECENNSSEKCNRCFDGGDKNMCNSMPLKEFDEFLTIELNVIKAILASKSDDYSTNADKLANFKLQGRMDGITPIEALRGNWLKHRASIVQGLDELKQGKIRPIGWWEEKLRDDRNYNILLHALIQVTYFGGNKS